MTKTALQENKTRLILQNYYSARRLMTSRLIESTTYCNQPSYIPTVHKTNCLIESFDYCYRNFVSAQSDLIERRTLYF
jgi:hypothetical protein